MERGRAGAQRGAARPVVLLGAGLAVGALLLALLMGQRPEERTGAAEDAEVASVADCLSPDVLHTFGLRLDSALATSGAHAATPASGHVPRSFSPAGVLVCQTGGSLRDGAGTWTVVTSTTREGTAAQLADLLAALDGAPAPATATVRPTTCAADGSDRLELWLVDSMGRAVRPRTPADGCGRPTEPVLHALEELAVTGQSDSPVSLVARATAAPAAPGR